MKKAKIHKISRKIKTRAKALFEREVDGQILDVVWLD
jgi:hypothetical protein